jgi:hypothetical protein
MVPIGVRRPRRLAGSQSTNASGARRRGNDGHQAMAENRHEGVPTYTVAPQRFARSRVRRRLRDEDRY